MLNMKTVLVEAMNTATIITANTTFVDIFHAIHIYIYISDYAFITVACLTLHLVSIKYYAIFLHWLEINLACAQPSPTHNAVSNL